MIGARKPGRLRRRADQALVQQRKRDRDRARAYRGGRRDVRRAGIEADDPRLVSVQKLAAQIPLALELMPWYMRRARPCTEASWSRLRAPAGHQQSAGTAWLAADGPATGWVDDNGCVFRRAVGARTSHRCRCLVHNRGPCFSRS